MPTPDRVLVAHIFRLCAHFEVPRVDTQRLVTRMLNQLTGRESSSGDSLMQNARHSQRPAAEANLRIATTSAPIGRERPQYAVIGVVIRFKICEKRFQPCACLAIPSRTRSAILACSNSAMAPRTCSWRRPAGVVTSIPSERLTNRRADPCKRTNFDQGTKERRSTTAGHDSPKQR
jgi:hypothetical protein